MLDNLAPLLGALAICLGLLARSMPMDRALAGLNIASLLLWASHFLLLGGYGAAASLTIGAAISAAAVTGRVVLSRGLLVIEVAMIPLTGVLVGLREMVPLAGGALFSFGVAFFGGKALTLAFLAGELIWLTYSIWLGASFAIANGLMAILALALRTVRQHGRDHPAQPSDGQEHSTTPADCPMARLPNHQAKKVHGSR